MTTLQQQARALGDPTRHRIFRYIADSDRPADVTEMTAHFGLNHNAIRQHLAKLVDAGLVVESIAATRGRGRPRLEYIVDPAADGRWGVTSPYERLSVLLTEMIHDGESPVEAGARAGRRHRVDGSTAEHAVAGITAAMAREGFDPELRHRRGPHRDRAAELPVRIRRPRRSGHSLCVAPRHRPRPRRGHPARGRGPDPPRSPAGQLPAPARDRRGRRAGGRASLDQGSAASAATPSIDTTTGRRAADMAIIERPPPAALEPTMPVVTPATALGVFRRPVGSTGWRSWLFTVDHKRIGIMYGVAAIGFFIVGGIEALAIRAQLAGPDGTILSADVYNQMFTMHATSMIFLFAMPMAAALGNYLVPLQIGARDVAFPRINAFGLWCFVFGGLFINTSWILGGAADGGWFMYAPNSSVAFSPTNGIDLWALGLQITGIASLTGAINLIVTILNMRAPGMSMMRVPTFSWMILVTNFLLLFAIPVITVALVLLTFQRSFGATFFSVEAGADPLLWQHLFWIFGHPEVYILILPAFGIVSEVLPVFSKKPLFGYPFVVLSGAAIGFAGWGVWAHHMFASGIGPVTRGRVLRVQHGHRRADRGQDHQLDADHVGRQAALHHGHVVRHGAHRRVRHRRAVGCHPRRVTVGHAADRHLLHRRPHPLRAVRRHRARVLRRLLLLVAEDLRQVPQRAHRQVELLADAHRHELDVRADAHHRPAGPTAADVRVDGGPGRQRVLQPRVLEPRRLDRRLHPRRRGAAVPDQHRPHPPQARRLPRSTRGTPARWSG